MKKKLILLPLILGFIYFLTSSYSSGPGGSGLERTGATGTVGCGGGCHTSGTTTTVAIELDTVTGAAVTAYSPGGSYIVKVTGVNTSTILNLPKFGFQVTCVQLAGAGAPGATYAGTLATSGLPASTHNVIVSGVHVVEHSATTTATTGTGGTGTTYVRSIAWTPPVAGTGSVKFYAVVNAVNGTGGTDGDAYNTNSLTITERTAPVAAITGTLSVCVGANTTLADATTGGTWSSGATSVATVTAAGVVHGVSAGTAVISYNAGAAGIATVTVTVNPLPAAGTIGGPTSVCVGSSISLTNTTFVGTGAWSTAASAFATVNVTTGVVTGIAAGTAVITYTATNLCGSATTTVSTTINALPNAGLVTGADSVCVGSSISLASSGTVGGTWFSPATGVATVTASGVVGGVSTGLVTISYTVTTPSCGSATASHVVKVKTLTGAGTISGPTTVCQGATISLASTVPGGTWSPGSTASIATVNASGVVGGASGGTATISYNLTEYCGISTSTYGVLVNPLPTIAPITGTSALCVGSSVTLADAIAGGVWSTADPLTATVNPSGMVTGTGAGTTNISYTVSNSCGSINAIQTVTVGNPVIAGTISGLTTSCVGSSVTLTSSGSAGGTWVAVNPTIGTINASGVATGVSSGTATFRYVVSNGCGSDSTSYGVLFNPLPVSGTITGASTVCVGSTITLVDLAGGGTWASGTTASATVTSGGVVTGVAVGTTIISYTVTNSCGTSNAIHTVVVNAIPSAGTISGATSVCVASSISLSETATGGVWSTGAPTVATVNASGVVTGLLAGTAVITYTVSNTCGSATATRTITVNPLPVSGTISGASTVCVGSLITLSETATGGTWSSGATAVGTVTSGGVVTGVSAGTTIISYTVSNGCGTSNAVYTVVVNGPPSAGTISGSAFVCVGTSASLSETVTGGTWTTNAPSFVTVSASGVITGTGVGSATISYTVIGSCGTSVATYPVASGLSASAGTITGPTAVCVGSSITLTDLTAGGVWTSSSTALATVSASGQVTGVSAGAVTITYTVSSSCGIASTSYPITVNPLPVAGVITGTVNVCVGATVALSETMSGGTWSSSAPAVATVDASGNVTGVSAGTFIAVYTVTNGCGSATALHTMISNIVPVAATITGANTLCQGSTAILTASIAGGTWSASNNTASVSTSGIVTGLTYGIDTISYTSSNICGTATATFIDTIYPTALTGGIIGAGTACIGDTLHYSVVAPGGVWSLSNGNAVVDSTTGFLIPMTSGLDTLTYTLTNICGTNTANLIISVQTAAACAAGVNTSATIKGISIYPNPTDGIFTLEMPALNTDAVVTIVDMLGKVIETKLVDKAGGNTTFNLSSMAAGSYIIKVTAGDLTFRDKIVIW